MGKKIARRKCKCRFCGKEGYNDEFYRVSDGNRNIYYCNKEEFLESEVLKVKRNRIFKYISEHIFTAYNYKMLPPVLKKRINDLADIYNYDVVLKAIETQKDTLAYWMGREDKFGDNIYGQISYFMTIVENNINPVWDDWVRKQRNKEEKRPVDEVVNIDVLNDLENNKVKKTEKVGIMEFLTEEDV